MKHLYTKPYLVIDRFALTACIAGNCEVLANLADNECGYYMELYGVTVFTGSVPGCQDIKVGETEIWGNDGLCYHNPMDTNNVFSS